MNKIKFNVYSLISCALFFAIFKPYFLPTVIRQLLKVMILVLTFIFILLNAKKEKIINGSLFFSSCVIISSLVAASKGNYGIKDIFESALYALAFYDLYTFIGLAKSKGYFDKIIKSMYKMNLLYCILTVFSVLLVGIENNSNQVAYLFGNKFTSAYLFILLISLYSASHRMSKKRNKMILCAMFFFSIIFSLYIGCGTATVTLTFLLFICLVPERIRKSLINAKTVVIALVLSGIVVMWIEQILNIELINKIVFIYFKRSYTIAGRLEIYSKYLKNVIMDSFLFGHGYSNTVMRSLSDVYANAQNGLLEIFVSFGFIGVVSLVLTVYYCFKKSAKNNQVFYLSLVVYGMIIAGVFEISLNWFFLLGLFLIRWSTVSEKNVTQKNQSLIEIGGEIDESMYIVHAEGKQLWVIITGIFFKENY